MAIPYRGKYWRKIGDRDAMVESASEMLMPI